MQDGFCSIANSSHVITSSKTIITVNAVRITYFTPLFMISVRMRGVLNVSYSAWLLDVIGRNMVE